MFKQLFGWNQPKKGSASAAKERLQIIVSHQNKDNSLVNDSGNFVQKLQNELISVLAKYVNVTEDQVRVSLENSGKSSVLELNVTLPENAENQ